MTEAADKKAGGEVFFYHMTRSPLEATLPVLLSRSLENEGRVLVRGTNMQRLRWLDEKLWQEPEDGFLPHALSGGPHDADQPVLLTAEAAIPNGANALISIDGADISDIEMTGMARVSIMFDGNDPDAVAQARGQWKAVVAAGCTAKYWSQENGPWEMKASS